MAKIDPDRVDIIARLHDLVAEAGERKIGMLAAVICSSCEQTGWATISMLTKTHPEPDNDFQMAMRILQDTEFAREVEQSLVFARAFRKMEAEAEKEDSTIN